MFPSLPPPPLLLYRIWWTTTLAHAPRASMERIVRWALWPVQMDHASMVELVWRLWLEVTPAVALPVTWAPTARRKLTAAAVTPVPTVSTAAFNNTGKQMLNWVSMTLLSENNSSSYATLAFLSCHHIPSVWQPTICSLNCINLAWLPASSRLLLKQDSRDASLSHMLI